MFFLGVLGKFEMIESLLGSREGISKQKRPAPSGSASKEIQRNFQLGYLGDFVVSALKGLLGNAADGLLKQRMLAGLPRSYAPGPYYNQPFLEKPITSSKTFQCLFGTTARHLLQDREKNFNQVDWGRVGKIFLGKSHFCPIINPINLILGADATGRLRRLGSNLGARGPHCICQQLSWLHVGAVLMLELCWIQVGPCWVHVGATWSSVGTTSAHVPSKLGLGWPMLGLCWGYNLLNGPMLAHLGAMLGLCWPICGLCWGQVRPFVGYVGAMLTHLRSMLGPCSPVLELSRGFVDPPEVILG